MRITRSCRTSPSRICLLVLGTALGWGCASEGRWTKDDYHLAHEVSLPSGEPPELIDLSEKVYLLSDNQRHELLGTGITLFRNSASDVAVEESAIRPPQVDLFGQDLLREALKTVDGFVLHLGDACDISNTGEFARFMWDMRGAPHGWAMAPGNHDGFFMGNTSRWTDKYVREWEETGESYAEGGEPVRSTPLQKDRYVSYYLASLILQDRAWSGALAGHFGTDGLAALDRWSGLNPEERTFTVFLRELEGLQETVYEFTTAPSTRHSHELDLSAEAVPGDGVTLRRFAWRIDVRKPWRSYVTQELEITSSTRGPSSGETPVSILLVDTSQYYYQPAMEHAPLSGIASLLTRGHFDVQLAGTHGNVLETQEDSLRWMSGEMTREGRRWLIATHHPFADLGRNSPNRFGRVRDAGGIPVTLSSHTHAGELRWNHDGRREGDWLEINVGSMLDAPTEFRDLQIHRAGERVAITSNRFQMEPLLREAGLLAPETEGYRPGPDDPDGYTAYRRDLAFSSDDSEIAVKIVLLAAYHRMFTHFDADHEDQSATAWPTRADGSSTASNAEVVEEAGRALDVLVNDRTIQDEDLAELTRLLYDLREYDRTRNLTDEQRERVRVYRLAQAVWAGNAEREIKGPLSPEVDPEISFLLLPGSDTPDG